MDPDALVIGSGPNGLTAAAVLARHGWRTLLLEAQDRPGGALWSVESTLPGHLHDVGAAFFPFAEASPAFRLLDLAGAGLRWAFGDVDSSHPAPDGSCASISRDLARTEASLKEDGPAWASLHRWMEGMGARLAEALLAPLPGVGPALRLGVLNLLRFAPAGLATAAGWSQRQFRTEAARRIVPGLALHVDLGPDDFSGAALGLVLALHAAAYGFRVPVGGARAIAEGLLSRFREGRGEVRLRARVKEVIVRGGRAVAVRTADGLEVPAKKAIVAAVGAPALYLKMLAPRHVPGWVRRSMGRFRYGWGTFKMDWALAGPVPWKAEEARRAAVVHAGDDLDDLRRFTREVRAGKSPTNPYLVIGQQSLLDATRAPAGCHTLWAYSHVPSTLPGGWVAHRESFADRVEERIEGLAPGFRQLIRARAVFAPDDLERMNENLVGGDLGGGSAQLSHQLFFRPLFPYFRYRTPVRGLYLASASAHPGAGVHGSCGLNAARAAIADDKVTR